MTFCFKVSEFLFVTLNSNEEQIGLYVFTGLTVFFSGGCIC